MSNSAPSLNQDFNHNRAHSAMWHFARTEFRTYFKAPMAIFWTFVYPLIMFFLMNAIFGGKKSVPGEQSYTDFLISGLAVMTVVSTALFSFAAVLIELRAKSRLKIFAMMPLNNSDFFFGFTASRVLILFVFCLIYIGVLSHAAPNGTPLVLSALLVLGLYLIAGALVLIGLSIMITSFIKHTGTGHAIVNIINIPLIFLSDLFLPISIFPPWLHAIANWSPIYMFVSKSRSIYANQYQAGEIALWIFGLTLVGVLLIHLGSRMFSWFPAENG